MDPNACFQRIMDAIADNDRAEAQEAAEDLHEWLRKGGFPPNQIGSADPVKFANNLIDILECSQIYTD